MRTCDKRQCLVGYITDCVTYLIALGETRLLHDLSNEGISSVHIPNLLNPPTFCLGLEIVPLSLLKSVLLSLTSTLSPKRSLRLHKHLDVRILVDLTWKIHRNHVLSKANQRQGFMKRNYSQVPPRTKDSTLYHWCPR